MQENNVGSSNRLFVYSYKHPTNKRRNEKTPPTFGEKTNNPVRCFPMVSLSQARDMFRLQREAKRVKKELQKIQVEAEADGVTVVVSGEQEVLSITINESANHERVPLLLKDALNRALKKSQVVSAEKMQSVYKEMGLPTEAGMREMGN